MRYSGNLILSGEIRNAIIERLPIAPPFSSAERGRIYFNTTDTLLYINNGSVWISLASLGTGGSGSQPLNNRLSAISNKTSTGLMVQNSAETFTSVSLVAPSAGLTITNPSGINGNPTFALANGLQSLEALTTHGFVVQTSTDTFVTRSFVSASPDRIVVTNADGVAGSPIFDLATVTNSGNGALTKISVDSYGRIVGTSPVNDVDITSLIGNIYVPKSGGEMGGVLSLGNFKITNLATPTNPNDAVTKAYVDAAVSNGTGGGGKYYLYTANAADTVHVITHDLDKKYCQITVVSSVDDEVVMPHSIKFNNNNQLTVSFTTPLLCKVIITG